MKDEFQARTTLQEKAIRVEFEQQRIQTDRGFAEQREYMDERFDDVDGKFDEQRKYMDRRFDDVDEKFDSQRKYMDGRFEVIDRRFEQVNNRFEKVDERFDRLEGRFDQMEGRFHNSMLGSAWEEIYPIGMFNPLAEPGNRFRMPKYFPNRVVKFWRLKRPRQRKSSVTTKRKSIIVRLSLLANQCYAKRERQYQLSLISSNSTKSKAMNTGAQTSTCSTARNRIPTLS